jgi:hypothetical protein
MELAGKAGAAIITLFDTETLASLDPFDLPTSWEIAIASLLGLGALLTAYCLCKRILLCLCCCCRPKEDGDVSSQPLLEKGKLRSDKVTPGKSRRQSREGGPPRPVMAPEATPAGKTPTRKADKGDKEKKPGMLAKASAFFSGRGTKTPKS